MVIKCSDFLDIFFSFVKLIMTCKTLDQGLPNTFSQSVIKQKLKKFPYDCLHQNSSKSTVHTHYEQIQFTVQLCTPLSMGNTTEHT